MSSYHSNNNSFNHIFQIDNINSSNISNNKPKKMIHSKTFENIFSKETNWSKEIKEYEAAKKNLAWGKNPPAEYIKKKYIDSSQRIFNIITQKYLNKQFEEKLQKEEKSNIRSNIINSYDKELSMNQSFDIINFKSKILNDENLENSSKNLQKHKKFFELSPKINYNILSNIDLKDHHFSKPEKRPNLKATEKDFLIDFYKNGCRYKNKINYIRGYKDYNLIDNEYKENNKEKNDLDLNLSKLKAAKNYYKFRNRNPITGIFYDSEKEKDFKELKLLEQKKLLEIKKKECFNPFNNIIYDIEKIKLLDNNNFNKKSRYTLRSQIEDYNHKKSCEKGISSKKMRIDNNQNKLWELIKKGSNNNEIIARKKFLISNSSANELPNINKNFRKRKVNKIILRNNQNDNSIENNCGLLDKESWFSN